MHACTCTSRNTRVRKYACVHHVLLLKCDFAFLLAVRIPLARRNSNIVFVSFISQESILQDSGRNKDALVAAKREFNSTRDAVNLFSDQFYAIVDHVRMPSV